jgi:hypothetical protein
MTSAYARISSARRTSSTLGVRGNDVAPAGETKRVRPQVPQSAPQLSMTGRAQDGPYQFLLEDFKIKK